MRHIISINDFSKEEIFGQIIPGCESMIEFAKIKKTNLYNPDKKVIFAFFEPSTRTKGSYIEAARLLGWYMVDISGVEATSLTKNESMANTVRMFAVQGADALVMRTKIEGAQKFAAEIMEKEGYNISIQNGGDGTNQHPTQTMLDLLTISKKLRRLDDFKIGFFGDLRYGRTVHSLLCALAHRTNISLALVSARETALEDHYKKPFKNIEEGDSLELLKDCDIIYGTRLQLERFTGDPMALERAKGKFKLTLESLKNFKSDVLIMHPLPYVEEITPEIRSGDKRVIIDEQAWYGIPTRIFLLEEGYANRKIKTFEIEESKFSLKEVEKISLDEYFKNRKDRKKTSQYFSPITNGTVIDHIPQGLAIKILGCLSVTEKGVKHIIEDVPSGKMGHKGVLVLENNIISKQTMATISSLAPTITFNVIEKGAISKYKIDKPSIIAGIGKCPNKNCITNHDPEATQKFIHNEFGLRCFYCEKYFNKEEVI